MSRLLPDITATIGCTPIVKINRLAPSHAEVFVKLEAFNPAGSVKDRMALGIIESAERDGTLKPGQTVVEATSGNTGIALAMVCAQRGYPFVAVMSEGFSIERRKLMRFLGAKVVLTPASERGGGMLAKAVELADKHGWFLPRQFENDANAEIHSRTTAREIVDAFDGERFDAWVSGFGTGGTLYGVARVLREERPQTRIVVAEPDNAPVLASGIPQERNPDGSLVMPHPAFRTHLMQGWGPDFISKFTEAARGLIDEIVPVNGNRALEVARELARQEGILTGISGGATLAAAIAFAEKSEPGSRILCMLPDTGERYLSTPLFADISVHMTPEETEISRSTPGYRFDGGGTPAKPPAPAKVVPLQPRAVDFVESAVYDAAQPVVMFALEWCEFCWSVRKMFTHFGIAFRSIDIDSVQYQKDNFGGAIRAATSARSGMKTIPQIYVGGTLIGGCTELFDAWRENRVQPLLRKAGVAFDETLREDPYSFFPAWLHPRG